MHLHLLFFKNSHHFLPSPIISVPLARSADQDSLARDSFSSLPSFPVVCFLGSSRTNRLTKDWSGAEFVPPFLGTVAVASVTRIDSTPEIQIITCGNLRSDQWSVINNSFPNSTVPRSAATGCLSFRKQRHKQSTLVPTYIWKSQCNFSQHFMKIMRETMAIVGQLPLLNRCEPGNKIMRSMLVSCCRCYYVWRGR